MAGARRQVTLAARSCRGRIVARDKFGFLRSSRHECYCKKRRQLLRGINRLGSLLESAFSLASGSLLPRQRFVVCVLTIATVDGLEDAGRAQSAEQVARAGGVRFLARLLLWDGCCENLNE